MLDLYLFLSILRDWWWVPILVLCAILLIVAWFVEKAKNIASRMADKYNEINGSEDTDEDS